MESNVELIKVSAGSNPQALASVIARAVEAGGKPQIRAIGASAVNQAAKACAIACGFVAPKGISLVWSIGFSDVPGDSGDTISAITFRPVER